MDWPKEIARMAFVKMLCMKLILEKFGLITYRS